MKNAAKLLSILLVLCMLISCGANLAPAQSGEVGGGTVSNTQPQESPAKQETPVKDTFAPEAGTYNEGVVLVKYSEAFTDTILSQLNLASATPLYSGAEWYSVMLKEGADTVETVNYLRELGCFEKVDYDYIMGVTAEVESVDISGNPAHGKQNDTFKTHHIKEGWDYLKKNGQNPGGSPDVVVAVIDTGVDYNHLDLRNNIWINSAEIPDNGKDDDGNGYIDDLCGWDCVGDDKDPMDDNGHGTHVAGIIAAENNKEGGVGVAYNCKIMVLKAGNSSGYFNNSDIAEAIQYAYMNGADVINMSFGGSNISIAVEEALEEAYNTSILVAAAGNDGACNELGCIPCPYKTRCYPAALSYVIGVMSTDKDGKHLSSFSNYDHYPYGSVEYEVYAVGEGVYSTWPGNKYATLNGTSMAAPMVSGIAALLRSYYTDRDMYSTKFIQSQIVNTGTVNPHITLDEEHVTDEAHSVVNVLDALTKYPKPSVNLYDYYFDDSISISNMNNGNGVIDAGETVRLYISFHNRGGVASEVNVTIDTIRNSDFSITDPYFTFINTDVRLSDIGTYSVRNATNEQCFEIVVDKDCPNDYLCDFNINFTYKNGMDADDHEIYSGKGIATVNISHGFYLPKEISEDMIYKADKLYIVADDVVIANGATVTFEEGCEIQFYADKAYYDSPKFIVYGDLNFAGSKENVISLYPCERYERFQCVIEPQSNSSIELNYVNAINLSIAYDHGSNSTVIKGYTNINNCVLNYTRAPYLYVDGVEINNSGVSVSVLVNSIKNSVIYSTFISRIRVSNNFEGNFVFLEQGNGNKVVCKGDFCNNIIYGFRNNKSDTEARIDVEGKFENNRFITRYGDDPSELINVYSKDNNLIKNNEFATIYRDFASQIISGYYDANGNPSFDVCTSLSDATLLLPYVVSVEMFDKDGNPITTVGREEIKVRVTFNRPMDVNAGTFLTFGTIEPYGDYRIDGEYISDTVWEGTYTLKAQIENGQNFLEVKNAWAAEDRTKIVLGEYQRYEFSIDTTAALSMNLIANPLENGIELNFVQDDYDTLLGYNVYRSTEKDGNYVKLNPAILLPDELSFLDENAEPGKTYWYTYTVVLTDFTESNPAGKVQATAMDTMAPSLYHTPVNQGYMNNNLVITCTATDNVGIQSVVLYYRTVGTTEWKSLTMVKQSDKFSAKIYGNELALDGLEYYIVAYDDSNSIAKGSAEAPYTVVIKDASAISRKGDVDGDGVVTTKDALMLMQCLNGDLILSDDEFRRADLNGDGVLNSSEALRILQYINGKVNTLEM